MSTNTAAGSYRFYEREESPWLWIEIRIPGRKKVRFSSRTKDDAEAHEIARRSLEALQSVSFEDAVMNLFDNAPLKESTRKGYRTALRHLDGRFGDKSLSEITREDLLAHISEERGRGVGAASIRLDLAFLSSVISWAQDTMPNAPEHNVVRNLKKRQLKVEARERFLTREEVDRLKENTTETVHADLIEFAVQTGMRLGELLALRWSWVSQDGRVVTLPKEHSKNGKPRPIVLSDTARDTLRAQPRPFESEGSDDFVWWFRDRYGEMKPMRLIKTWWTGARKRAGLEDVRFHDLRHTFASWWRAAGGHDAHMRNSMGHLTPAMSDRYAHLDVGGITAEMERLGRIRQRG